MTLTLMVVGAFGCSGGRTSYDPDDTWAPDTAPDDSGSAVAEDSAEPDEGCDLVSTFPDLDGDGWGADAGAIEACSAAPGWVTRGGDCDDEDPEVSPDAVEVCFGGDEDCDGLVDEAGAVGEVPRYTDLDGDHFGDPAAPASACETAAGYTGNADDCDDTDATVHPEAQELCDDVDRDCDGVPNNDMNFTTWFLDLDGDGYGDPHTTLDACSEPTGYTDDGSDCDDADASVHPSADDTSADGIAQDCETDCSTLVYYTGNLDFSDANAEPEMFVFCGSYNAVDGQARISDTSLTDLSALGCLCEVSDDLWLSDNPNLTDLSGLSNLQRVGDYLYIHQAGGLTTLGGLGAIESIGSFHLSMVTLTDLSGLEFVSTLEYLNISEAPSLTSLAGLDNLETITGNLSFSDLYALTDLSDLSSLTEVEGNLTLGDLVVLASLGGLDRLTRVGGTLRISNARLLTTTAGMTSLTELGGLWVTDNDVLVDLDGFEGVVELPVGLYVGGNPTLPDLQGLESVTSVGYLYIRDTTLGAAPLSSLDGLQGLTTISGDVSLYDYAYLTDLSGLDNVTEIGGYLGLTQLSGLTSLHGLDALTRVGSSLSITTNPVLADVDGLAALEELGGNLLITDNVSLPTADATALSTSIATLGGTVTISGNGP